MSLGMASKFNILQKSPYDFGFAQSEPQNSLEEAIRLVPSRYNIRASVEDGRLVVWNTLRGTMNVFQPEQRAAIERLLSQKGILSRLTGAVKYLHDRGFLVKAGTNEYRQIQLGFGQQHYRTDTLQLILLASEDCNFRCTYCYEDFAQGTMQPWVRKGVKNLVQTRLPQLRRLTASWFGGEPLYGFEAIEDLAPFFSEVSRKHNIPLTAGMTTNGYLLTPEVAEKLLSWQVTKYQITLDGAPEDHDRNRPARDGQGTFATIFENLTALKERPERYLVDIRVNFDPKSSTHLNDLLDLIEHSFAGDSRFRMRFRPVGRWGGPNDDQLEVCGIEDSKQIQEDLRREALRRGLKLSDPILEFRGMGSMVCYAARPYNFIVGASGKIMKCTVDLDKEDRNVVGRLTEQGDLLLDQDKMALWTEPAFESDEKCQKCVVLPTCHGISCPLVRFENDRSPCISLRYQAKKEMRELVQDRSAHLHLARSVSPEP